MLTIYKQTMRSVVRIKDLSTEYKNFCQNIRSVIRIIKYILIIKYPFPEEILIKIVKTTCTCLKEYNIIYILYINVKILL